MRKHIANIITGCRIVFSIILLFLPPLSAAFCMIYLLCGFSDMIDGTIARKSHNIGEFGAKFDAIADLIFVAVSLFKLLPAIHIPEWLRIWIIAVTIIRISNLILGFIHKKRFISLHTTMNKITGLLLFLLPLSLYFIELKYSSVVVCSAATLSALQEGYYIGIGREKV